LISSQSIAHGARFGVACSLGIFLAGVLHTCLVAVGLGQLVKSWPVAATVVRFLGAAYLAYLGANLLWGWYRRHASPEQAEAPAVRSAAALIGVGILSNLLNPKVLLFFSVFIPQFVNQNIAGSPTSQIAIWGGLLCFLALAYNLCLSMLFAAFRPSRNDLLGVQRHSDGLLGILFLLLAACFLR